MEIEDQPPHDTPFAWIGGETRVQTLVDRFYDLMDLEAKYAQLRATHGTELDRARQNLFWFLCGWLGGPQHYTDRFGHPRLRMRHMPFVIGQRERDAWLTHMLAAVDEVGIGEPARAEMRRYFDDAATFMINNRTNVEDRT